MRPQVLYYPIVALIENGDTRRHFYRVALITSDERLNYENLTASLGDSRASQLRAELLDRFVVNYKGPTFPVEVLYGNENARRQATEVSRISRQIHRWFEKKCREISSDPIAPLINIDFPILTHVHETQPRLAVSFERV